MKKLIVVLVAVLAVLSAVVLLCFGGSEGEPAANLASIPTAPEPSAEMQTEPPTEAPTQAPEELLPAGAPVILNGTALDTALKEGVCYVRAEDFAAATGLGFSAGGAGVRIYGRAQAILTADEPQIQVNGVPVQTPAPFVHGGVLYAPLFELSDALGYAQYTDSESGQCYITTGAGQMELPEHVNVPVLMYHAVSDDMWGINELFVSPSDMEMQLQYLLEQGYEPIWFEDLAYVEDYEKPVLLTFDDGYDDNYTELFPLLKKYQVKATIFVIGNAMGTSHKMTEEQVRELADSGLVSIQSHGMTHDDMDAMDEETLVWELGESQRILTRVTGRQPYVLCYPTGKYSDLTLEVAARYYGFGIKMVGGQYNTSDNPLLVNRYYVSRYTSLDSFASMLSLAGSTG